MAGAVPRVRVPELPIGGGCECGAVRYRITQKPITCYACHCTVCQRQSGSAFGMSIMVPADGVEVEGRHGTYPCTGGYGRPQEKTFCPTCGTRITHRIIGGEIVVLKPGTLDDHTWIVPAGHIFTATKQRWIELGEDDGLLFHDAPDLSALRLRWCQMTDGLGGEGSRPTRL